VEIDGASIETEISNLSLGGAFIATTSRLTIGTRLQITFRVPTLEEPLSTGAQVRWTGDEFAGVQFDGLRAKDVWSLNKYFESLP